MIPSSFGALTLDQPVWLWLLLLAIPVFGAAIWFGKRKLGWIRWTLAGIARTGVLLAIVLSLAGLSVRLPVDTLGVVFVVDRSASLGPEGEDKAMEFIEEALKHQAPEDESGVVVFGATAMVEAAPRSDLAVNRLEARPSPHHSDLASGIRLASAILPADRARRIIILSDGEQTRGDAAAQVLLTAGDDLQIATVTLPRKTGPEVLVEDVLLPPRVDEGAPYEVRVVARTNQAADATLRLYRNEDYLGERKVHLEPGEAEVLTLLQHAESPGLYQYRAALEVDDPSQDTVPQNNEAMASIQVTGKPRILVVERNPNQARHLVRALKEEGLGVDVLKPVDLPSGLTGLRPWAAVILSDVPAYQLTNRQQEAMESYVRDLGRGLAMVGGEESFGLGGYYETPIERALPVNMDLQDKTRFPKLGMVLAIDKSCSMGGGAGSKLGLAKEAAILSSELLNERDLLGVIGFDHAAAWVVPLQDLHNKDGVQDLIAGLRPGGGTDIYPALKTAADSLDSSDAALKHIILLSDGITAGAAFETLLKDTYKKKITVSTLAFGTDADRSTMEDFAKWGGGQYYLVTDPKSIPQIFTRETMLASRSFLVEGAFKPEFKQKSLILEGIEPDDLPTLLGFVATEAKPRTVVALQAPANTDNDKPSPLLVHGRYGLGRSLAFTSDAKMRWAKKWVGTESYTQMWTQVGRWLVADAEGQDLEADAEIRDGELIVTVDAFDEDGDFRNFLEGEGRVVAPDLTVVPIDLRQVGPGRYQGRLPVDQDGSWLVGVALSQNGLLVGKSVAEAVQPWSPEYRGGGGGGALMSELARLGGGGEITDPAAVFARPPTPREVPWPLWPHLIWIAAALLLADVAMRRLEFGRETPLEQGRLVPAGAAVPIRGERKIRKPARRKPKAPRREAVQAPQEDPVLDEIPDVAMPSQTQRAPRQTHKPESYAGRLLAARKRAGTRSDDDEENG
ncbi:MAG: VWA domain-containing protein [Myxococcota bacterium]